MLVRTPFTVGRAFATGVVFGTAFGVSMKTSLMLLAVVLALLTLGLVRLRMGEKVDWRQLGRCAGAFLAGLVIVPAAIVLFFVSHGAWSSFYYCVIQHNALPGLGKWTRLGFHQTWFPLAVPIMFFAAQKIVRAHRDPALGRRRVFPLLAAGFLYYPMRSYWPLLTRQDFLPIMPLVCLGVAAAMVAYLERKRPRGQFAGVAFLALLGVGEIALTFRVQLPWEDKTSEWTQNLAMNLRLIAPSDLVLDAKGETIFRDRPCYWVMEGITTERFRRNLIVDDLPERLIQTRTCAATPVRMPLRAKKFIWENYLPSGTRLFYLGKSLGIASAGRRVGFALAVPARYCLVCERGTVEGVFDGKPYEGSQTLELEAGPHEFQVVAGEGRLAIVWAPAIERGFQPFKVAEVHVRRLRDSE
jgi:hypothetical protein